MWQFVYGELRSLENICMHLACIDIIIVNKGVFLLLFCSFFVFVFYK